ncbi:2433_t:CDS:2 [Funneliformis caledonium]|uniref:2433_t:CDS:1 n=1 Tax=Funneliformis caledonium TaxID=1117310 RepID=A0A9N8V7L0_9GLOM|nr:2433_t:CDS:2 [Funneliformis caledonium]
MKPKAKIEARDLFCVKRSILFREKGTYYAQSYSVFTSNIDRFLSTEKQEMKLKSEAKSEN